MSPTSLNFVRVQLLILPSNSSHPRQNKLTLTPSTLPGRNHGAGRRGKSRRGKTHPANSLLTNCKNGGGGRDGTLPRGQDATHAGQQQHVRMRRLPLPQCQRRTRPQDGRGGGTLAPTSSAPPGPDDPAGHGPPSGQKSARSAKGGRPIAGPGTGRARAGRRSRRDEGATVAVLRGPGIRGAGPPGGGAGASGVGLRGSGS